MTKSPDRIIPFNSPLETGLRSLCILVAAHPGTFDLQQLIAFDYLVVHTGDIEGAPSSLHPKDSKRNGELLVRRQIVERGLLLMESKRLIQKLATISGFRYQADEFAPVFLESLTNLYMDQLLERSKWVVKKYESGEDQAFPLIYKHAFDRWTTEFQFQQLTLPREQ